MNNIETQGKRYDYDDRYDRHDRYDCMEPYVGMPLPYCDKTHRSVCDAVDGCPLAMAYVPMQQWCQTYEPAEGWHRGTIFPELDMPFLGGGGC